MNGRKRLLFLFTQKVLLAVHPVRPSMVVRHRTTTTVPLACTCLAIIGAFLACMRAVLSVPLYLIFHKIHVREREFDNFALSL